ncbi:MAG: DUF4330 family protein [Clostridia bacterium]|nr:DUF4330 family protein [Clostridia bacterium]
MPAEKRERRFSVIDFVIILIAVAAIAVAFIKAGLYDRLIVHHEKVEATVTFVLENASEAVLADFKSDAPVYYSEKQISKLDGISSAPQVSYVEGNDGKLIAVESDDRFEIEGRFRCTLTSASDGYLIDGAKYVSPGTELELRLGNSVVTVTVIGLVIT